MQKKYDEILARRSLDAVGETIRGSLWLLGRPITPVMVGPAHCLDNLLGYQGRTGLIKSDAAIRRWSCASAGPRCLVIILFLYNIGSLQEVATTPDMLQC
jgi:hypothetical protein